ncbi:MAG: ABC-F family ATP-binding cassette domain-containing protein [candidate division WOR-3 bacterium]|nr:MAG: ABC-F family ATP-binding cassette domain-containing protein [candidate division WOR-3 bacterium]
MITFDNVRVEFGVQELYRDVSLMIGHRDRLGLVGPNGSGKSTILRMMVGEVKPTEGEVRVQRGVRVAYLPQSGAVVGDNTVLKEALSAFSHVDELYRKMVECEKKMGSPGLPEKELKPLLEEYARLQHGYEKDGYDREARAKKVLVQLGFGQDDFDKRVKTQSGGFQVRLTLARMLLEEPDLLLLDEPTNYLDIRSIEWLQEYLSGFKGAFVMIAHDRYLLDGLVQRIWAIESRSIRVFQGNYSQYLADRELRDEQQQKEFEEQQAFIKRSERFISRFKGRKDTAKRAQSRQKVLDKMERIAAPREDRVIRIRFPEADEVHGRAFRLRGVTKGFDGKEVLGGVDLGVRGGEKVGVFGPNGAGKTTLLRMIAGRLEPDRGELWWSRKTRTAYYEQGSEDGLDGSLTVLDLVKSAAEGLTENELKGILGTFLFSGDDIGKKVSVLSGGERSRLAIISVLLSPSNLLIMDEPTNHLDIQSRDVLIGAMARYDKTVVFAAHDRFMLDRLAEKTIRVEGGEAVLFPGNYSFASRRVRPAESRVGPEAPKPKRKPAARLALRPERRGRVRSKADEFERRLVKVRKEYEQAKSRLDLNRARELAQEEKELAAEIERLKAEELAGSRDGNATGA